ncbi:MAG TPA: 7TM-DISM domain-containing protein [Oligoflexus sp.]|uniref:7TM-DISM domain-containing protein n=1 Tax=Oligoflexus sp. TaxID=1971216 RepID=UPI002D59A2ED|nr:7TM-DISM domain-containing protein [Oligoflexus sp.]HYX37148.1 7TM-DISM domain-containing protein [Oligoflexus sp.]
MLLFHKLWIIILLFCSLGKQAAAQPIGRVDLSLADLKQNFSLALNENIWRIEPKPTDSTEKDAFLEKGTHPTQFLTAAHISPGTDVAIFQATLHLDHRAELSIMIPEYPFYELYLGERLLVKHGEPPNHPQRLYREVYLGEGTVFPLKFKVQRHDDLWAPYTLFRVGLSQRISQSQKMTEFYGAFFLGLIVITTLYHLALALIIPQNKQSFYFALFLLGVGLRASLSDSHQILIRIHPHFSWEWSWKLGFIGYFASLAAFLSFVEALFPQTVPKYARRLVWRAAILMILLTLITKVNVYSVATNYFHLLTFFTMGISLRSFARAWRLSMPGVKPFIATVVVMTAAVINDVLIITFMLQSQPLLDIAIMVSIFSQTVIISYNYANSFRDIVHVHKQLQKIVYKHVVTQIAQGRNLEETMPVGNQEAVVLSFDVIGSSHIKHPQFNRALERLMAACQEILHEGYDPFTVSARGYRIKEMGDGLLASIGFPLANPDRESHADTAVETAIRFCDVFRAEMEKLQYAAPLYCSVGITQGRIEGFFPKSGIKQYDIRGRPLILATRYESMRNIVFKVTGEASSLIFIQDEVYQGLSPSMQHDFERWDCLQKGHRIRDDVNAVQAWYCRRPGAAASGTQGSTITPSDSIGPGPRAVS